MQNVILSQIPINELTEIISETIKKELQNLSPENEPTTEFITRKQTAELLGISLVTLHDWTKKGIIKGYRINTRIRYKKSEVLEAVKQIHTLKYGRV
jgi:excisionase family DNA binding protein